MRKRNPDMTQVSELVQEVLGNISPPYPENITDKVCLAIQNNSAWLSRYKYLLDSHGKWAVNSQIGRSTRQLTGLKNLGLHATATSELIKTFTRLG
jgi:hypothetical protein